MNIALNKLESIANRTSLINVHHVFYPEFNNFSNNLLRTPIFFPALNQLCSEETIAIKAINVAEKNAIKELKSIEKQARKYVIKYNAINPEILSLLDQEQKLLAENKIVIFPLEQVFFILLHDEIADHSLFLKKFGKINRINDCKYIITKDIFPKYCAWINQEFYLTQQKQSSTWHSLHLLRVFHERYNAEICDSIIEQLAQEKRDSLILQQAHNDVIRYVNFENQPPPDWLLIIEEYKIHILRIVAFLKENLPSQMQQPLSLDKITNWSYIIQGRYFEYQNKRVRFHRLKALDNDKNGRSHDGIPSEVFKVLMRNKVTKWSLGNMLQAILRDSEKDNTKTIYDACRQINKQISTKCGLQEFLIITTESVQINPQYLD